MTNATAAIIGSGNIGTDLMFKLLRSDVIDLRYMVGHRSGERGPGASLASTASRRSPTASTGCSHTVELPDIVFEATSAYAHVRNAPTYSPRSASGPST